MSKILLTLLCGFFVTSLRADNLTLQLNGKSVELVGEILIEAQDSSLYFRSHDGKIWFVKPTEIVKKTDNDDAVPPINKKELGKQLLAELPAGFKIYETKHYVIAYQTEPAYARWIGGLYEGRLYRGFEQFWEKKKKLPLSDPAFPLVAIIFESSAEYNRYVTQELGAGQSMVAYYNLQTNRITLYDLTAELRNPNQPLDDRSIEQIVQTSAAIPMVATIIHEGTHQLMFNRGVQTRFAETPLWLNEGLAIYFETPALDSARGWKAPGLVNEQRLLEFRRNLATRPADALQRMIQSDEPFRNAETAIASYAEAWAFNHFLLNKHSEQFVKYVTQTSAKKPLIADSPEKRLAEFQEFLGDDWQALDQEFIEYARNLR